MDRRFKRSNFIGVFRVKGRKDLEPCHILAPGWVEGRSEMAETRQVAGIGDSFYLW